MNVTSRFASWRAVLAPVVLLAGGALLTGCPPAAAHTPQAGHDLYESCKSCHGARGEGAAYVLAPSIAGTQLTGVPSFIKMDHYTPGTQSEPYRLYSVVQPPLASAAVEVEPNEAITTSSVSTLNYFSGALSGASPSIDVDVYRFTAVAGDLVFVSLDGDPTRNDTTLDAKLELLDSTGSVRLTANDSGDTSSVTLDAGSLTVRNPTSPSEALVYRVRTAGTYYVRVTAGSTNTVTAAGDYLLSIAKNCVAGP